MACSLDEIKQRGTDKVKDLIKGNARNIVFDGNVASILLKGKKIRTKEQALAVAQKKQEAVEKWSEETFGSRALGGWTNILDSNGTVRIEVNFPPRLAKAYERKIELEERHLEMHANRVTANEYTYGGQVYSSLEDMQAAMEQDDFFPAPDTENVTNYAFYISSKKSLLKKVTDRYDDLMARRRYESNRNLKTQIKEVKKIKDDLEAQINELVNADNMFERTMSMFNDDIALIKRLIEGDRPLIDDIHTAESMISFFDVISDYSSSNTNNHFVDVSQGPEPDVKKVLDRLRGVVTGLKSKIYDAKKNYLLELVRNSPKLKSIFPDKQEEEIRDELLSAKDDIGIISQYFGTVDKQFTKEDSLLGQLIKLELESSRSKNKSYAAEQIQRMDDLVPKVKKILLSKGYGISWTPFNKLFSEVSYDMFYQRDSDGLRTGRLIGPFSDKWYKAVGNFYRRTGQEYSEAMMARDWGAVNTALINKYKWVRDNAEFLEIGKIPEIAEDPRYAGFKSFLDPDPAYAEKLKRRIGKQNYERLVEDQMDKLDDYLEQSRDEVQRLLDSHGVTNANDLPVEVLHSLNITLLRNNPFKMLDSHNSGQEGRVDYHAGNSSNQYQSHMKYNTFYPKAVKQKVNLRGPKAVMEDVETNYYDPGFDEIAGNPTLLEFWENLNDSTTFMNSTLSDSSKRLVHNSLPHMQKFTSDILLDKDMGTLTKFSRLWSNTKDHIGNLFSTNIRDVRADDLEDINKSGIQHIQDKIGMRAKTRMLQEQAKGTKMTPELSKKIRAMAADEIVGEQTFNLPVVMRAYLDMVAEYKSQKDSLPKISVFKNLYENIRLEKSNRFDPLSNVANIIRARGRENGIQDKRLFANIRMNHWFNKNVMNLEDKAYWVKFGKFYTTEEQELLDAIEEETARVKKEMETTDPMSQNMEFLNAELFELEDIKDNLGKTYTLAEMYNAVVNKFRIFVGLAYNIQSNITNRFQGWYSGAINDTGKYWTAGNFTVTNSFISKKGLRMVPGHRKYKNEIKKTRLMIDKLNIIQDATNEIDRARNDSGFTGIAKKLNPFYLTEYTEWHNQTPQILAILMDQTIKDKDGNEVPVFDGTSFPAHRIAENGELVLTERFATEENKATWQDFSNQRSADVKSKISDTIAILNGDYSRTGSTYIKSSNFGKTVMTFKTWLPNQIWQRFAYNQKNIALGKERFDGTYTGSFASSKTSTATTALAVTGLAAAGVMGMGIGLGGLLAAGVVAGNIYMNRRAIAGGEELMIASQLAGAGKAVLNKLIGIPVNTVAGKDIIKAHKFDKLNLTEAELQNLQSVVTEISVLLGLALAKVIMKSLLGPNDEDEPVTFDGNRKHPNPYYGKNLQSQTEKEIYLLLENQLTKTIKDVNLYMNPQELYNSMTTTSMYSWFDRIEKISGAVNKASQGLDEISTGPNAGESRLWNEFKKTVFPSIGQGRLGFERMMETEFDNTENMDSWFYTDYKKDRKIVRARRTAEKEKLTLYWKEQFGYDDMAPVDQKVMDPYIEKLVNDEVDATTPYPQRFMYDEEQKRIEGY